MSPTNWYSTPLIISIVVLVVRGHLISHWIGPAGTHILTFIAGTLLLPILKRIISLASRAKGTDAQNNGPSSSIYGLDHGRLHLLRTPPAMWMNMGYWDHEDEEDQGKPKSLATACRDLVREVLKTAGFSRENESSDDARGIPRRSKGLLDLGFGCGDQTVYLLSDLAIRESDKEWWDDKSYCEQLTSYIGLTKDRQQFHYAEQRIQELQIRDPQRIRNIKFPEPNVRLFCADAAKPDMWSEELKTHLRTAFQDVEERWVLALDTLYHFSPSRWPVIHHISHINASFMAFDLCLSSHISTPHLILLRILTSLMGAPWANFITIDQYREKLVEAGYADEDITIRDISDHVFGPLATFLEHQDRRLGLVGYGIGAFWVARWMFAWWGREDVVRGVVVVARRL